LAGTQAPVDDAGAIGVVDLPVKRLWSLSVYRDHWNNSGGGSSHGVIIVARSILDQVDIVFDQFGVQYL
jgi:hypothetical protein